MTNHTVNLLLQRRKHIIVNLGKFDQRKTDLLCRLMTLGTKADRSNIKFMHLSQSADHVLYTSAYAAGHVVADSLISNVLLGQTYYKPNIVNVLKALISGCNNNNRRLLSIHQVLGLFVGHTWRDMFEALLLEHGVLALGLLRAPDAEFGNTLPFVYTNPVPSLILKSTDRVYVLAQPGWSL